MFRVALTDGPPLPDVPALLRNGGEGETDLRVSPSGGLLLLGDCKGPNLAVACVRQPNGSFKSLVSNVDLSERGAGPLAEGGVAFLRGLDLTQDEPSAPLDAGILANDLRAVAVGADGTERALAPIGLARGRGHARVQSPMEEGPDHALRCVVEDGEGPAVVTVDEHGGTATTERLGGVVVARLHAQYGLAVGEDRILTSVDWGETWNPSAVPDGASAAVRVAAGAYEEPGAFIVSEVGARIGPMLRLGWRMPETPLVIAGPAEGGVWLDPIPSSFTGPGRSLTCTSNGPSRAIVPVLLPADARRLLQTTPPAAGTRRESMVAPGARYPSLDTLAILDEEGPDGPQERPSSWVFRWIDQGEIGARVRGARVSVPSQVSWGASLRLVAGASGQALFVVYASRRIFLVRVPRMGPAEVAEVTQKDVPTGDVVFGDGTTDAVAWIHDTEVVAWLPRTPPRRVARVASGTPRVLGTPSRDGIPLLIGSKDWLMSRWLALPTLSPAEAATSPAPRPSIDGYVSLAPFRQELGTVPPCGPTPHGMRFFLPRHSLRATLDGSLRPPAYALYDVRVDGTRPCVAGVDAAFSETSLGEAASFVRADFTRGRAEGGARGSNGTVRAMTCALRAGE